jgi:hypothetical protein
MAAAAEDGVVSTKSKLHFPFSVGVEVDGVAEEQLRSERRIGAVVLGQLSFQEVADRRLCGCWYQGSLA